MPFINGRYYVNPIMGEAMEAAREAEAALLALENRARQNSDVEPAGDSGGGFGDGSGGAAHGVNGEDAPIHRVEIEAAELVPAHSGRATRGYVARVHRQPEAGERGHAGATVPRVSLNGTATGNRASDSLRALSGGARMSSSSGREPSHAETHVFADHRDLVSFLRDELAKDSHSKQPQQMRGR
jgi:hypothetical protein